MARKKYTEDELVAAFTAQMAILNTEPEDLVVGIARGAELGPLGKDVAGRQRLAKLEILATHPNPEVRRVLAAREGLPDNIRAILEKTGQAKHGVSPDEPSAE